MKMIDFYKSILNAGAMAADEQGLISAHVAEMTLPISVGEKRLVLPLTHHVANPNKSDIVIFHPLAENILRGESDVMAKFRTNVNLKLNMVVQDLIVQLIALSGSNRQLKPEMLGLLSRVSDADDTMIENYRSLFKAMPFGNSEKCVVHIFIKKNAQLEGKTHRRGAIVSFPLYEELLTAKNTVYGVKMRKKDIANLKEILEGIFPGIEEKDRWSRPSQSDTCPTLDALLRACLALGSCVNSIVEDFEEELVGVDVLRYDGDWVESAQNLAQFDAEVRMLPMQAGNDGTVAGNTAAAPATAQTTAAQHLQTPNPTPSGLQAWDPNAGRQSHYGGMYTPQQQAAQMPNPNAAPRVAHTQSGLVDFAASMQNNPQLMPPTPNWGNGYGGNNGYGQSQPRQRVPSWERNDYGGGYGNNNNGYGYR